MHDQAAKLRKLARESIRADATLAPGGPVIALSGAQPAVGVTTAACGLARELARLGKQVILIDANLTKPNILNHFTESLPPNALNIPDQLWSGLRGTLEGVLDGTRRAVEALLPTLDDGLRLLPGCSTNSTPALNQEALDRFATELAALTRQADVVLIDAGAGMNAWVDRLWQLACHVLIVAPPTAQGLLDAYATAKLAQYHRHDGKLRLLFNRTNFESEAASLSDRFAETCQRFLSIRPKPAATLPAFKLRPSETTSPQRQQGREDFHRSLRLLAADLTAEIRVASLRLIRPSHARQLDMKAPGSAGGRL
jgi:MinD-like ATPase involved in chromosome partitioning or flagellar assembly